MGAIEQMIRERAYELWDRADRPDGRSDEFWFAACVEFERDEGSEEVNRSADSAPLEQPRHEPVAHREKKPPSRL